MRIPLPEKLISTPIAHRGLWGENVPENSIPAFSRAQDNGYPIEIDLYQTTDGEIVVFHDVNLFRMTGLDKNIYDCAYKDIKNLKLNDTEYSIPTLAQVLNSIDGKVPLLIELKDQPSKIFIDKVVEILLKYSGEFAIQSFNPFYLMKIKKKAPNFILGVLGTDEKVKDKGFITRFIIKRMPFNFIIKPDFISYRKDAIFSNKFKKKKLPLFVWTITSKNQLKLAKNKATNVIFENFIPE